MLRNENSRGLTAPGVAAGNANRVPLAVLGGPLLDADWSSANGTQSVPATKDGTRSVPATLFDLVERAGGRVALDATEGGPRTLPRPFDAGRIASDPFRELADAYFDSIADPFRRPDSLLYEWLERELAAKQVKGILLWRYVWCDLWHAESQRLKEWSPVPLLEIDVGADDLAAPARVEGRIETFLEMLK